jgi:hypothetical protein
LSILDYRYPLFYTIFMANSPLDCKDLLNYNMDSLERLILSIGEYEEETLRALPHL